ncbi:hypothetical protein BS78_K127200 [Paspalum vaginatum]|uniref:Uncharacterized protein n=1 Tax=Paspalum vaginatum TaxID=158149 RepID=A0A9W8CGG4_9POAL|nr:hypothetical protein BS78_K127200 [Paspalum vaginatum]
MQRPYRLSPWRRRLPHQYPSRIARSPLPLRAVPGRPRLALPPPACCNAAPCSPLAPAPAPFLHAPVCGIWSPGVQAPHGKRRSAPSRSGPRPATMRVAAPSGVPMLPTQPRGLMQPPDPSSPWRVWTMMAAAVQTGVYIHPLQQFQSSRRTYMGSKVTGLKSRSRCV